jgi:hypothetical protein
MEPSPLQEAPIPLRDPPVARGCPIQRHSTIPLWLLLPRPQLGDLHVLFPRVAEYATKISFVEAQVSRAEGLDDAHLWEELTLKHKVRFQLRAC